MNLFNPENELYCVPSGVFLTKFRHNCSFLYLLSLIMREKVEKKKTIAMTLCFIHQSIFRPNYIFNNAPYFYILAHKNSL